MQQYQERISFAMCKPRTRFSRNKQGLQDLIAKYYLQESPHYCNLDQILDWPQYSNIKEDSIVLAL
jgi:hypothetical protein